MPRLSSLLTAALLGVLGCLASFGPNLRARGVHAGVAPGECMNCHESEADALARMHAAGSAMVMDESGPPLVADWMVGDPRACTDCHRVRP